MIYVDEMRGSTGRRVRCHLIADDPVELRTFAALLGLPLGWVMAEGSDYEHFEISEKARDRAIEAGAQAITLGDLARKMSDRRSVPRCEKTPGCRRDAGHYGWCLPPNVVKIGA